MTFIYLLNTSSELFNLKKKFLFESIVSLRWLQERLRAHIRYKKKQIKSLLTD